MLCYANSLGEVLQDEGHIWVGMDISSSMLDIARDREVEGDLFLQGILYIWLRHDCMN